MSRSPRCSRLVAAALALAIVGAACTRPDADGTATKQASQATDAASTDSGMTMNDALGGTQAVQDFAIFVGMWDEGGDRPESFYRELLEAATEGSSVLGELSGGFTLSSVKTIGGLVVDDEGNPIPSLRADYATLDISAEDLEATVAELVGDAADGLDSVDLEHGSLLVEVITADYSMARTHAGPGDRALMDLTGVESVKPGDDLAMQYIFGQTYPGDPEVERDLAPLDLFRYRWNNGLLGVLVDPGSGAVGSGIDRSVEVIASSDPLAGSGQEGVAEIGWDDAGSLGVPGALMSKTLMAAQSEGDGSDEGPTLSTREIKQLVLADLRRPMEQQPSQPLAILAELGNLLGDHEVVRSTTGRDVPYIFYVLANGQTLYVNFGTNEATLISDLPDPRQNVCESGGGLTPRCTFPEANVVAEGSVTDLLAAARARTALLECERRAARMNEANQAQTPVVLTRPESRDNAQSADGDRSLRRATWRSSEGEQPPETSDDESPDSGDDPLAPQPGPVSCTGQPPSGPPELPNGMAWGDIHVNTIDGKHYANQAVGEFLLFDNGVAEVQMRTAPWIEDGPVDVSVATAFAVRIGEHDVSMHADGTTWVDGERAEIERGQTLAVGDGEVLWWDQGWVVLWPDGTVFRAQITEVSQVGEVTPADGPSVGLLGDFDGDPENDFFTRDGEVLDPDLDQDFEAFYDQYVDSWRVTDEESAFHYDDGKSTATFTDPDFPRHPSSVDDLPADVLALAEEVCAQVGVTRDAMLADCILDVGATGEPGFAYQAYLAQEATPEAESVDSDTPTPTGGGENTLVFGDTVIAFGPSPPVVDPSAPAPSWTCEVADGVFTALSSFGESPTVNYDLDVQYISPGNARGLDEAFRLIVRRNAENHAWVQTIAEPFADAVASVSLEGGTLVVDGVLYVNDPPVPGLGPINPLPDGAVLTPFTLQASC